MGSLVRFESVVDAWGRSDLHCPNRHERARNERQEGDLQIL
jgi:hypothetical protein